MHATLTYPTLPGGRFFTKDGVRGYRFGFNGKEKVDEVYGDANAYDFGGRLYDPRLGRWLAVDIQENMYTGWSPYNFSLNSPLQYNDPNGEWVKRKVNKYDENGKPVTGLKKFFNIGVKYIEVNLTIHGAKVYNGSGISASPETMQCIAENIKYGIEAEWTTDWTEYKGRYYKTKTTFAEPVQVITNINDVKDGPKGDNLIYIAHPSTIQAGENPYGANLLIITPGMVGLTDGTYSSIALGHEFGHGLNARHNESAENSIMHPFAEVMNDFLAPGEKDYTVLGKDIKSASSGSINGSFLSKLNDIHKESQKMINSTNGRKNIATHEELNDDDSSNDEKYENK